MSKHTRFSELSSNLFHLNVNLLQDIAEVEASVIRGGRFTPVAFGFKPIDLKCTCGRTDGQHDPLCGLPE